MAETAAGEEQRAGSVRRLAHFQLIATAVLFSTGGAAIKATTLTGWQVATLRSGFAALTLLLFLTAARRGITWRSSMVGVAFGATMVLFVVSNKLTTAANTVFLQSTYPLYVLLLSPFLLGEPIRRRDVLFMAVVALGFALFFIGIDSPMVTAPDPLRGNILAATSGLTFALTIMGLRWMSAREGAAAAAGGGSAAGAILMGNVFACLVTLPAALPIVGTTADWLVLGYLGIFQIAVAYIFLITAARQLSAVEIAIVLMIEPVLNPVWAWLWHGERPGAWPLVGGAIIVLATIVKTLIGARAAPEPVRS
jgi:drug/metabolite transporter (DMT)-like permease